MGGVEVLAELVDVDEPVAGDGAVSPGVGAGEQPAQVLVALFGPAELLTQQCGYSEPLFGCRLGSFDGEVVVGDGPADVEV